MSHPRDSKFSPTLLKSIRKQKGFTQTSLAAAAGVGFRTVQDWEYGRMAPGGENLKRLAEALSIEPSHLFEGVIEVRGRGGSVPLSDVLAAQHLADALQENKSLDEAFAEVRRKTSLPFKATIPPSKIKPLRSAFNKLQVVRDLAAQGVEKALEMESDEARQLGRIIAQMQKQILSAMDELDGVLKGD